MRSSATASKGLGSNVWTGMPMTIPRTGRRWLSTSSCLRTGRSPKPAGCAPPACAVAASRCFLTVIAVPQEAKLAKKAGKAEKKAAKKAAKAEKKAAKKGGAAAADEPEPEPEPEAEPESEEGVPPEKKGCGHGVPASSATLSLFCHSVTLTSVYALQRRGGGRRAGS